MKTVFQAALSFCVISGGSLGCFAGTPLWDVRVSPGYSPEHMLSNTASVTVQYTITNFANRSLKLLMLPEQGLATSDTCILTPRNQVGSSCTVNITVTGAQVPERGIHSGPVFCAATSNNTPDKNQCYRPASTNQLSITKTNINSASLTLSVNALTLAKQGALTAASGAGNQVSKTRKIVITNNSSETAYAVGYSFDPVLPAGTTTSPSSCGDLSAGDTCIISIIPGTNASGMPGSIPTPSVMTVTGSNTSAVTASIIILDYSNQYQGGLVFDMDDTTPDTQSVGGKVLYTDASITGLAWGPMPIAPSIIIPGIMDNSIPGASSPALPMPNSLNYEACLGKADGACNTRNIVKYYDSFSVSHSDYRAGVCADLSSSGYTDWYLPAICEFAYDPANIFPLCGTSTAPYMQNIYSNLYDIGQYPVNMLNLGTWHPVSTQSSSFNPAAFFWGVFLQVGNTSFLDDLENVFIYSGIDCVRKF